MTVETSRSIRTILFSQKKKKKKLFSNNSSWTRKSFVDELEIEISNKESIHVLNKLSDPAEEIHSATIRKYLPR